MNSKGNDSMVYQTIMMTLALMSIFSIASGQLTCFVCTDCPNIDDDMLSQRCDLVPPPDTTSTTLSTTTLTPTVTTTSTTILPPDTSPSTPHTPPTATTTSVIPPTISDLFSENDILMNELIIDKSTDLSNENRDKTTDRRQERTQITLGPPYWKLVQRTSGTHQCFRIGRTVGDRTEVIRGCVVSANTIHQTCVRANNGITPASCRICQYNDCNAATRKTTISVVLLFTSIVYIALLR